MARTNSVNFTGANQFPMASAGTDIFKKEDVQVLAKSTDLHDHSPGLGLPVSAASIPAGAIDGSKITDGTVTSAKIQDGTIATADLANQSVTNAKLGTDTARSSLLTNGGFEIWQRGAGPFTVHNTYLADRWLMLLGPGGSTLSMNRDGSNVDSGSQYSAAATHTLGTSGATLVSATDIGAEVKGLTFSFSIRVRTSTANAIRPWIEDGSGPGNKKYGAYHPGDGTWRTLTVVSNAFAAAYSTTLLQCGLVFDASCTANIDNAMLV